MKCSVVLVFSLTISYSTGQGTEHLSDPFVGEVSVEGPPDAVQGEEETQGPGDEIQWSPFGGETEMFEDPYKVAEEEDEPQVIRKYLVEVQDNKGFNINNR